MLFEVLFGAVTLRHERIAQSKQVIATILAASTLGTHKIVQIDSQFLQHLAIPGVDFRGDVELAHPAPIPAAFCHCLIHNLLALTTLQNVH